MVTNQIKKKKFKAKYFVQNRKLRRNILTKALLRKKFGFKLLPRCIFGFKELQRFTKCLL